MLKKAADGSNRRLGWSARRSSLALVALAAIGAGVYYVAKHESALRHPSPMVNAQLIPKRPSRESLQLLSELRARFAQGRTSEAPKAGTADAEQTSPLLPGLVENFEKNPAGYFPLFAASLGKPEARVALPSRANAAFELKDFGTGMRVQARLEGAQDVVAEMADGYAVYRQALGPNTTLLRRAMPNGSEDFFSFASPPNEPSVAYHVGLDSTVAGLRLAGNSLELLDKNGTPRLRVAPPYIVGANGEWLEAKLTLSGCAADASPSAPWGRTVTAPGAISCQLRVSWDNDAVEYPALLDPTWITTGSMSTPRQGHTATLLSTGKVLVAGGTNGTAALATAELYDRTTGTWAAASSMSGARQWHTAVQLNASSNPTTSGKVLIAGGRNGTSSLNTGELYSPSAGTWTAAANLNAARQQHTATLLPSGKVLVTGGVNGTTVLATAATYDPSSGAGTWTATTGPIPGPCKFHAATLISTTNAQLNGKVLVTGGNSGTASQSTVYLYDPAQLAFSTLAAMPTAREGHTATVMSNAKIMLAGGKNGSSTLNTAVVFDPTTGPGTWSTVGNMTVARQAHSASLLGNGQVLVAGGSNGTSTLSSAELFNGTTSWTATTAMPAAVQAHTATVLSNGIVLIAGGLNGTTTQSAARLYDVTGGNTCTSGSQCFSGSCVSGVCCNAACTDQCYSCSLTGLVGICSPKPNGTTCSDGNGCTQTDTCQAGTCTGANPVTCTVLDQCHDLGICNTTTGVCSNPNKADGTTCNDGNACTQTDQCLTGTCTGSSPIVCTVADACHMAGTCDPASGVCSNPAASDGTGCSDGNACTIGDACSSGNCISGTPVSCTASDECHVAGTCNSSSGLCSNPAGPDGTDCSWGTCVAGNCFGSTAGIACQSTTVTRAPISMGQPFDIASDGASLYWTDAAAGTVAGAALDGTSPVVIVSGRPGLGGVAVDDTYVYFTDSVESTVSRVLKSGGNPEILAAGQRVPRLLASDGDHLMWTNQGTGRGDGFLRRFTKSTGQLEAIADRQPGPWTITPLGGSIYWSDVVSGTVLSSSAVGAPIQTVASGLINPAVVTGGTEPYFLSGDGRVFHFDATTGQLIPRAITAPGVFSLAAFDSSLFWTNGVQQTVTQQVTATEFPSTLWRRAGTGTPRIIRSLQDAVWFTVAGSNKPSSVFSFLPSPVLDVPAGSPGCPPGGQGTVCDVVAATVTPILECVVETADHRLIAHFGYTNLDSAVRRVGVGPENHVDHGDGDACQPSTFAGGTHHDVFAVGFFDEITWIVGTHGAVASHSSPRCSAGAVSNTEVSP